MQGVGIKPNKFTFPFVLKACARLSSLQEGKLIHHHIFRYGFESDVFVGPYLVAKYAKCGNIEDARQVFDKLSQTNAVSWNALIVGYAQSGRANDILTLFKQIHLAKMTPDWGTMVGVLPACAHLGALQEGKWIHNYVIKSEFDSDDLVGTALIDMYAKCGNIQAAGQLFDRMAKRDVVAWSAMLAGYAQTEHADEALTLFHQMLLAEVRPDSVAVASGLQAYGHLGALQQGRRIHGYIARSAFELDVFVVTAPVDMYATLHADCLINFLTEMWFHGMQWLLGMEIMT
eukprot:Gb_40679 [translate_table: standard]